MTDAFLDNQRETSAEWLGPPPSAVEIASVLFVGVAGMMFAGVGPLLLGSLQEAGRLSAAQIGQAGMVELLAMGLAAGFTGACMGTSRLRPFVVTCGLLMAALNVAIMWCDGWALIVVRGLIGLPSGALVWLMTALIVRAPRPERWSAIYFTVQTLAQFAVVAALGPWVVRPFGANGGFAALAMIGILSALAGTVIPRGFTPLPDTASGLVGLPSVRGMGALAANFAFSGALLAVWIYIDPLSREAGYPAGTADLALSFSLAAQVTGGALATLLAGRMRWLPALLGCQAALAVLMLILSMDPVRALFLFSTAMLGGLWMFSAPLLMPLAIEADPSRRAAVLMSGAGLLGCSAGPLIASLVVREGDVRNCAILGCMLMAFAIAVVLAIHLTRRAVLLRPAA